MSDGIDLDDLTVGQLKKLRKALFEKMLFEPVATPGFKRPLEKLKNQVRESEELIERLQSSVQLLQKLSELNTKASEKMKEPALLANSRDWAFGLVTNGPKSLAAAVEEYSLPPDQLEKLIEKNRLGREIGIGALALSNDWKIIDNLLTMANLSCMTTCYQLAVVWAFLEKMTASLTHGTTAVFSPKDVGLDPSELAKDGLDNFLKEAKVEEKLPGLPIVSPAFHLLKAFLDYMRQDEIYEKLLNEQWDNTEASFFLFAYFNWWTSGGASALNQIATDGEQAVEGHKSELMELTNKGAELGMRLSDLGEKAGQYQNLESALPSSQTTTDHGISPSQE